MAAKYVIGVDLGTTNSVIAFSDLEAEQPVVELLEIPQLVAASTIENRKSLPSFLYLATQADAEGGKLGLPWDESQSFAIGEWARRQSADTPDRTVGGAKSWLSHHKVDRQGNILPWNAPEEVGKVSPVEASRRYLQHMVAAWNEAHPEHPFAQQAVVLTVPASFDASARELTHEAASGAGFPADFTLLEEPQAAVYSWLGHMGEKWRKALKVGDKLLVCDVGGGTTDLTLITVEEEAGELVLKRMAVGNHLLVGGDNMDLALAFHVAELFKEKNVTLDPWQSVSLWHSCRAAKEQLLQEGGPDKHPVSILGRGSKLIAKTVSVDVQREPIKAMLLEGFFPACGATDKPERGFVSGFQELGLPFESDPAVTRHLAEFLAQHSEKAGSAIHPTHVLFNGGVFKSEPFQTRLMETIASWQPDQPPQRLEGDHDLDYAVARGAAFYGYQKEKGGIRIRGGTAQAYYVGIQTSGLAIPGAPRPLHLLNVVPIGMEEGTETDVPSAEVGLVVGETTKFRFFSSPIRKDDKPGQMIQRWDEAEISETDSLEASLPRDDKINEPYVPVTFHSKVTELGMLELWCVSSKTSGRWKLEFNVREED
ncbi:Hsp70 family protein [Blastopirellula marina]|uniref:Hsp70 family protein n=1 Tax=Blastopirellula marina TaxID=124 RepID=A0A2S8FNA7_9BACT|nr:MULTISPECIES: Hsp70 family protein [Pirellulaceae]PQO33460.1 Hsp70 family protein [Blastopirellula marina]RCS52550.1 Hsp70 family protein [Bremerella cremea]